MIYVSDIKGNMVVVRNTETNKACTITVAQLMDTIKRGHFDVKGVSSNGKISVYNYHTTTDVITDWFTLMHRCSSWSDKQRDDSDGYAAVRNWGSWESPSGLDDYDWPILSSKWDHKLTEVEQRLRERYPEFNIYASTEEKQWIRLEVTEKRHKQ
jgi:hypothetical protein